MGWIAAALFMGGIIWLLKQNSDSNKTVQDLTLQNSILKSKMSEGENQLVENTEILNIVRSKDFNAYTLPGNQAVAPQAFAKVYLNKKEKVTYVDAKGLPPLPQGKTYQVWSLTMEPFVPVSLGLMERKGTDRTEIFKFANTPQSEAVGITLEPDGGSETPTLSQLYVLGMIPTN